MMAVPCPGPGLGARQTLTCTVQYDLNSAGAKYSYAVRFYDMLTSLYLLSTFCVIDSHEMAMMPVHPLT